MGDSGDDWAAGPGGMQNLPPAPIQGALPPMPAGSSTGTSARATGSPTKGRKWGLGVLVVVVTAVMGVAVISHSSQKSDPADAYGYTASQRGVFIDSCSRSAPESVCTCVFLALEKQFSPTQLAQEGISYSKTGQTSPEFQTAVRSSGCAP
jgi:hypothetical protein